jgi:hypothetical protein
MKLQFSMSTALLFITAVAIACGGIVGWTTLSGATSDGWLLYFIAVLSPYYIPIIFAAFAIGRRALTVRMVASFAGAQIAAIGGAYWLATHH